MIRGDRNDLAPVAGGGELRAVCEYGLYISETESPRLEHANERGKANRS